MMLGLAGCASPHGFLEPVWLTPQAPATSNRWYETNWYTHDTPTKNSAGVIWRQLRGHHGFINSARRFASNRRRSMAETSSRQSGDGFRDPKADIIDRPQAITTSPGLSKIRPNGRCSSSSAASTTALKTRFSDTRSLFTVKLFSSRHHSRTLHLAVERQHFAPMVTTAKAPNFSRDALEGILCAGFRKIPRF